MQEYVFKEAYDLFYTGIYGKQKAPSSEDWQSKINKITRKKSIDSASELFQVMEAIPPYQEVQSGFTYYWFKQGHKPTWEDNPQAFILEMKHEEKDEFVKENPDKWVAKKCELEGKVLALLLFWMGASDSEFTKSVFGIVIKIRRARITVQLWYDGQASNIKSQFGIIFDCKQIELNVIPMKDAEQNNSRRSSRASSREHSSDRPRRDQDHSRRRNHNQ